MKIYIAEDEPLASAKLKLFLEKLGESSNVYTFDNGVSLLAAINREHPDLLFLDIQMPGMTGMEVLERIQGIPVIITSAYDQYAIESFSFNVTDYLLKPYTLPRLEAAVEKAKKAIRLQELDKVSQQQLLNFRAEGMNVHLPLEKILYLEAVKDYVKIETTDNQRHMTLARLSNLEEQLSDSHFTRVHRSFIVNTRYISSIGTQSLILQNDIEIPIGKTYKKLLQ